MVAYFMTSSHVMLAEAVHSGADILNQAALVVGLKLSRRPPSATYPYGRSRDVFVCCLLSASWVLVFGWVGTFYEGSRHFSSPEVPVKGWIAASVLVTSFMIEGATFTVAIRNIRKGAASKGMRVKDYVWQSLDPTSVAVMLEDGAAALGLIIAGASLVIVKITGNPIYDVIGCFIIANMLGVVALTLVTVNRNCLIGRAMDKNDLEKIICFLKNDPVVDSIHDCKSEVIGPGLFQFVAEIDLNGEKVIQNLLKRCGHGEWDRQFCDAARQEDDSTLQKTMVHYGEKVVTSIGMEIDRLKREVQEINPSILYVNIEVHNQDLLP